MKIKEKILEFFYKVSDLIQENSWANIILTIIVCGTIINFCEQHLETIICLFAMSFLGVCVYYRLQKPSTNLNDEDYAKLYSDSKILGDELKSVIEECKNELGLPLGSLADYLSLKNWHLEDSMYVFKYTLYKANHKLNIDNLETSLKNILLEHLKTKQVRGIDNNPYHYKDAYISKINILDIKECDSFYEIYMVFACDQYAEYFLESNSQSKVPFINTNDNDF